MEGSIKICIDCNSFLNEIYQFVAKSKLIDAMFLEIAQIEQQQPAQELIDEISQQPKEFEYERHIVSIRHKFGLKPLEMPLEALSNLFDESNITGALEIKLESDIGEFEVVHDELSDDQDMSESSEEEEDESEIEQLSDSQLKKHEESRDEDSSSDGHEERKKRRKKYRKSDEEKLFE